MKRYWDSSALVDALSDPRIESLAKEADQFTRPHSLSEVFSTLTGGRLGFRVRPSDAAQSIRELTSSITFVNLGTVEILEALDQAERLGVRGGNIHDLLHACAAKKAGVDVLLTDNLSDFKNLSDGFDVEPP